MRASQAAFKRLEQAAFKYHHAIACLLLAAVAPLTSADLMEVSKEFSDSLEMVGTCALRSGPHRAGTGGSIAAFADALRRIEQKRRDPVILHANVPP